MADRKLRVLVVDDSALNRRNVAEAVATVADVEIVGKAGDGEEALRLATQLRPDVITLDLEMPKMDGFTFLRILMSRQPTPVIVVSSYSQKENVFKALELGAVDFIAKPEQRIGNDAAIRREIAAKIELVRHLRPLGGQPSAPQPAPRDPTELVQRARALPLRNVVCIASSTGGPTALMEVLGHLPDKFSGAILIAQHMPEKFTRTFAERLDKRCRLRVTEAADGDLVEPRAAFVAPGGSCMEVAAQPGNPSELRIVVRPAHANDRYVPSGDRLLESAARHAGVRSVGIILTGMGDDGVEGARAIRAVGGTVIAESEETAVVFGMPGAAIRAGAVDEVLPLPSIAEFLSLLA